MPEIKNIMINKGSNENLEEEIPIQFMVSEVNDSNLKAAGN